GAAGGRGETRRGVALQADPGGGRARPERPPPPRRPGSRAARGTDARRPPSLGGMGPAAALRRRRCGWWGLLRDETGRAGRDAAEDSVDRAEAAVRIPLERGDPGPAGRGQRAVHVLAVAAHREVRRVAAVAG